MVRVSTAGHGGTENRDLCKELNRGRGIFWGYVGHFAILSAVIKAR